MSFGAISVALAVAFAVHNFEEWRGLDSFLRTFHARLDVRLKDRFVFAFALTFLSVAVLALAVVDWVWDPAPVRFLCRVIVLGILLNAVWHCALSLYRRQLVPGTVSALFLIIPLAAAALYAMHRDFGDTVGALGLYALLSLLMLPVAIYGSLWAGYAARRLAAARRCGRHGAEEGV